MNSTTMAPKAGAVPELLVDIASISSRLFWLVRNSMSGAAAGLQLPTEVFTRFSDVVALRNAIDDTPPLLDHPQGLCRLRDEVIVDGVGPGRVNWIHPSGDVRVELALGLVERLLDPRRARAASGQRGVLPRCGDQAGGRAQAALRARGGTHRPS